jgi:hypothetical protein
MIARQNLGQVEVLVLFSTANFLFSAINFFVSQFIRLNEYNRWASLPTTLVAGVVLLVVLIYLWRINTKWVTQQPLLRQLSVELQAEVCPVSLLHAFSFVADGCIDGWMWLMYSTRFVQSPLSQQPLRCLVE